MDWIGYLIGPFQSHNPHGFSNSSWKDPRRGVQHRSVLDPLTWCNDIRMKSSYFGRISSRTVLDRWVDFETNCTSAQEEKSD